MCIQSNVPRDAKISSSSYSGEIGMVLIKHGTILHGFDSARPIGHGPIVLENNRAPYIDWTRHDSAPARLCTNQLCKNDWAPARLCTNRL